MAKFKQGDRVRLTYSRDTLVKWQTGGGAGHVPETIAFLGKIGTIRAVFNCNELVPRPRYVVNFYPSELMPRVVYDENVLRELREVPAYDW